LNSQGDDTAQKAKLFKGSCCEGDVGTAGKPGTGTARVGRKELFTASGKRGPSGKD